jgi:hypothetical protein
VQTIRTREPRAQQERMLRIDVLSDEEARVTLAAPESGEQD